MSTTTGSTPLSRAITALSGPILFPCTACRPQRRLSFRRMDCGLCQKCRILTCVVLVLSPSWQRNVGPIIRFIVVRVAHWGVDALAGEGPVLGVDPHALLVPEDYFIASIAGEIHYVHT